MKVDLQGVVDLSGHGSGSKLEYSSPVRFIGGVGPARAEAFARLGVHSAGDLLEYYPRHWVFVEPVRDIASLKAGVNATVSGVVVSCQDRNYSRPRVFEAVISDDTGRVRAVWFHAGYMRGRIECGKVVMLSGKTSLYKDCLQFTNPELVVAGHGNLPDPAACFGGAVYPAVAGLTSGCISRSVRFVLDELAGQVEEYYQESFLSESGLIARRKALLWIHRPPDSQCLAAAKQRLKYDELFVMELALAIRRRHRAELAGAPVMDVTAEIDRRIRRRFPFLLTPEQDTAVSQIAVDLAKPNPMNRLLQGDVGSGKTVVALYAALLAVANGHQVAIMAPTEVLAQQHLVSCLRYLKKSGVSIALFTGALSAGDRTRLLRRISAGEVNIVVGTVALLGNDVCFEKLGLVIIDEQHKFGVHQRAALRGHGQCHCLVMTATPIPRTLAMTAFGDLDVSVIRGRPPGAGRVVTRIVGPEKRQKAFEFIKSQLTAGRQAYFVYPRIDGNGDDAAAVKAHRSLAESHFSSFRVGMVHGRMPSEEKQQAMKLFREGRIDVLVSTVVVEVGLDVPNATVMVVEEAERFGLAQLHQLRGRVGRRGAKSLSYCLLFTGSTADSGRLEVITRTCDGFQIAEEDLRIRGPGELFSARQHGLPDLKIADIVDDYELLCAARRHAFAVVQSDPGLESASNAALRHALAERFGRSLGLADVA